MICLLARFSSTCPFRPVSSSSTQRNESREGPFTYRAEAAKRSIKNCWRSVLVKWVRLNEIQNFRERSWFTAEKWAQFSFDVSTNQSGQRLEVLDLCPHWDTQRVDHELNSCCTHQGSTALVTLVLIGLIQVMPSGKSLHNYGKSPCLTGKLTISMAIFNSFLYVYHCLPGYP